MATNVTLRRLLHRKAQEMCAPNPAGNTTTGSFIVSDKSDIVPGYNTTYFVGSLTSVWNYHADEDSWLQLPNPSITGTFGAGSCGEFRPISAPGGNIINTATAGTTTTLTTSLTITRSLKNCKIRIVGGAGIGYEGIILSNTLGANSIITVTVASGSAFNATTQYQIFAGSFWFFNAGTVAVGFAVYDRATHTWTSRSVSGLPTAWGTDAQLVSTGSSASNNGVGFVNGTATAGASSTITLEATKTFVLNQWTNYQIRIISGVGAGQIRTISSNTAGASPVITVSSAWTTTPTNTSVYRIEGNDDHMYLFGNNAIAAYKFTVSTNTWVTLAPVATRGGVFGAGGTADWVDAVQDTLWNDGTYGAHFSTTMIKQNGRYIYTLRGGNTNVLDAYDIAANTWISGITYGNQQENFTTGTCAVDYDGIIYIMKESTGRIYKFDVAANELRPFTLNTTPQGAVVAGDKLFAVTYKDSPTKIPYLYALTHSTNNMVRWVVF